MVAPESFFLELAVAAGGVVVLELASSKLLLLGTGDFGFDLDGLAVPGFHMTIRYCTHRRQLFAILFLSSSRLSW